MQNFSPLAPKLWPPRRKNRQRRRWIYTTLLSWHVLAIRYPFMSGWFMLQSPRLDACSRAIFAARTRWGRTTYSLICVVVLGKPRPAPHLISCIHSLFLFFLYIFLFFSFVFLFSYPFCFSLCFFFASVFVSCLLLCILYCTYWLCFHACFLFGLVLLH